MGQSDIVTIPAQEIQQRIDSLQRDLRGEKFDAALIMHNANLFYYTGSVQNAFLWVPAEGDPTLIVKKNVDKARFDSSLRQIVPVKSLRQIPAILRGLCPAAAPRLGMEGDVVPFNTWQSWQETLPGAEWDDVSGIIWKQRTVKSSFEVDAIRAAGRIVTEAFMEAPRLYQPGMTENELSALLVYTMRCRGHHGFIRTRGWRSEVYVGGAVSGGPSSSFPWPFDGPVAVFSQYTGITTINSPRPVPANEPILIDMLGGYNGYHYDFARTFVRGELAPELIEAHQATIEIRNAILQAMLPGAVPADIYALALDMAEKAGFSKAFMSSGSNKVRFAGHGIGLELDEGPVLAAGFTEPLQAGNVIALEPKIIFEGRGGVGLEDTVMVTEQGGEVLMPAQEGIIQLEQ